MTVALASRRALTPDESRIILKELSHILRSESAGDHELADALEDGAAGIQARERFLAVIAEWGC